MGRDKTLQSTLLIRAKSSKNNIKIERDDGI